MRHYTVGAQLPAPPDLAAKAFASTALNPKHWRATVDAPTLEITPEILASETGELFRFTPTEKELNRLRKLRLQQARDPSKNEACWYHAQLCAAYGHQLYAAFSTEIKGNEIIVYALI